MSSGNVQVTRGGARAKMTARIRFAVVMTGLVVMTVAAVATAAVNGKWWRDNLAGPDSSNFVDLDQIKKTNVNQLEVAWTYPYATAGFNPVVVDDVMYMTGRNG